MRGSILTLVFFVGVGITSLFAARWTDWEDLTRCSAKPCECNVDDNKCEKGRKVQIRTCSREEGDESICQYDGNVGPIKLNEKCENRGVCPGWSEWMPIASGRCDCKTKERTMGRLCDNPPPIHRDVSCEDETTGEQVTEQFKNEACECTAEEMMTTEATTTTTTQETTSPLPWCCEKDDDSEYDYDIDIADLDDQATTTTTSKPRSTKKPSQADLDYYDYIYSVIDKLPPTDCSPCTEEYGYQNATDDYDYNDNGGGDGGGGILR